MSVGDFTVVLSSDGVPEIWDDSHTVAWLRQDGALVLTGHGRTMPVSDRERALRLMEVYQMWRMARASRAKRTKRGMWYAS